MQDLDSFTSPILGFKGDIPIPAIPVSARDPGVKSSQGPSTRSDAGASRTRANKWKAPIDPSHQKKAKKALEKPLCGIKISDLKPKAPALTPPLGTWKGIPILRLKRYAYIQYFLLLFVY
jgi:hypothetical protein